MTATESLLPEVFNDFCNKIGHEPTYAVQRMAYLLDHLVGAREHHNGLAKISQGLAAARNLNCLR